MTTDDLINIIFGSVKITNKPVTYLWLWSQMSGNALWKGRHSQAEVMRELGRITDRCIQQGLPIVSAAVVRSRTGDATLQAKQNLLASCVHRVNTDSLQAQEFFSQQQAAVIALAKNQ